MREYCEETRRCRHDMLLSYFGEAWAQGACGAACDNCTRKAGGGRAGALGASGSASGSRAGASGASGSASGRTAPASQLPGFQTASAAMAAGAGKQRLQPPGSVRAMRLQAAAAGASAGGAGKENGTKAAARPAPPATFMSAAAFDKHAAGARGPSAPPPQGPRLQRPRPRRSRASWTSGRSDDCQC